MEGHTGTGAYLAADEALLDHLFQRQILPARERVIGRGDETEDILQKGVTHQPVGILRYLSHDHEVVFVAHQPFHHPRAVGEFQPGLDGGVLLQEMAQEVRHEIFSGGDDRELQGAGNLALQRFDFAFQSGQATQRIAGRLIHYLAGRGGKDLLSYLLQQRKSQLFLQPLYLDGDRWLGEMHLFRGTGEAAVSHHRLEQPELLQCQVHGGIHLHLLMQMITRINFFLKPGEAIVCCTVCTGSGSKAGVEGGAGEEVTPQARNSMTSED